MAIEQLKDADSAQFAFAKSHVRVSGLVSLPVYGNPSSDNPRYPNGAIDTAGTRAVRFPCRIVRLHAPIESMTITWAAVKYGAAPLVPNPYLFDQNYTFQHGWRTIPNLVDGLEYPGHLWAMSGEYHYIIGAPLDLNSSINCGISPWESQIEVKDAIIPNTAFINTLLEPAPTGYTKGAFEIPIQDIPPTFDPNNP